MKVGKSELVLLKIKFIRTTIKIVVLMDIDEPGTIPAIFKPLPGTICSRNGNFFF